MVRWSLSPTSAVLFSFFLVGCTNEKINDAETGKTVQNGDVKKKPSVESKDSQEPNQPKPELSWTAEAITRELLLDEKSAKSKYENKVAAVTGNVYEVSYADVILLKGEKEKNQDVLPLTVRCNIAPQYVPNACRLSYGQKVSVVGKISKLENYSITLDHCTLTEVEPSGILVTTAEAIAREFEADPAAARAKYKENRNVIFSGLVEDLTQVQAGPSYAKLAGHGKLRFSVHMLDREWEMLRKGQIVQIRCQTGFDIELGKEIGCGGILVK